MHASAHYGHSFEARDFALQSTPQNHGAGDGFASNLGRETRLGDTVTQSANTVVLREVHINKNHINLLRGEIFQNRISL